MFKMKTVFFCFFFTLFPAGEWPGKCHVSTNVSAFLQKGNGQERLLAV